ncbi:MAG: hypothetical protein FWG02_10140, partial [Holophagaceae bacterium]|nr:hypothetical protein [Holophagaceae bacterium]
MGILKLFRVIWLSLLVLLPFSLLAQTPILGSACTLLYVGDPNSRMQSELYELLSTEELAEMCINLRSVKADSKEFTDYVSSNGVLRDSLWALLVNEHNFKRQCLIQGVDLPKVDDISSALDRAGIKSPVRVMRDFLKKNPDHLDAREGFSSTLRGIAETRTKQVLNLGFGNDEYGMYQIVYRLVTTEIMVDTSRLDNKVLEPEQDIKIWGEYAQELQTLFNSGDWRLIDIYPQHWEAVDVCSPTMVQLYRRHLPKVEAFLEAFPLNEHVWKLYGWMVSITKHGNTRALLERIIPPPDSTWPTAEVLSLVLHEETSKENWSYIAETLLDRWSTDRFEVAYRFRVLTDANTSERFREMENSLRDVAWKDTVRPLLESLIKTKRTEDAEDIISEMVRNTSNNVILRMAGDLAQSLGRADLHSKWLELQIAEKTEPDDYDLGRHLPISQHAISVFILGVEEAIAQQIDPILKQGPLLDWRVIRRRLNPGVTKYLQLREGWPENEIHWVMFNGRKLLADGHGIPTEDVLILELESFRIPTLADSFRRFNRENPDRYDAKEMLLRELKRVSEQKVRMLFGAKAGDIETRDLTEAEDIDIWGEYATLYRQTLPFFLEQGRAGDAKYAQAFSSELFIHSPTMKLLARRTMPQVEYCLQRQPINYFLWFAWVALSNLTENKRYLDFIEALLLSPQHALDYPLPLQPISIMLNRLASRSDWHGIIAIQERRWE